jgi:hypothetical protein
MTKIAGALNMLPKTFLREGISNPSTKKAIEIYRADGIETISRLKVLVILKEDLPLSLLPTKLR